MQKQKGISTIIGVIIIIVVAVILFGGVFAYQYFFTQAQPTVQNQTQLVGGDRDSHGCIGSAGYTWCEAKQKCLRPWEEPCEADQTAGCLSSGGKIVTQTCYCANAQDFYNTCLVGACGCGPNPAYAKQLKVCQCGQGKCFDGQKCVTAIH